MAAYTSITIIFNPKSTGQSKKRAHELQQQLATALPKQTIDLLPTKYAGHAEKLAYDVALATKMPLIISVSGDGGYNEVVNGIVFATKKGARAVAGLLPAGNANDHYHSQHDGDFVEKVISGKHRSVDVLKLTAVSNDSTIIRYAHSYIGFGLTPKIGRILTTTELNHVNQVWIVVRALLTIRYSKLEVEGHLRSLDSIIISNIDRMAKLLTLSRASKVDDGLFEVSEQPHRNRLKLLWYLLKASTKGLSNTRQTDHYHLRTVGRTLVQCDGEVIKLKAGSEITITIEQHVLKTII